MQIEAHCRGSRGGRACAPSVCACVCACVRSRNDAAWGRQAEGKEQPDQHRHTTHRPDTHAHNVCAACKVTRGTSLYVGLVVGALPLSVSTNITFDALALPRLRLVRPVCSHRDALRAGRRLRPSRAPSLLSALIYLSIVRRLFSASFCASFLSIRVLCVRFSVCFSNFVVSETSGRSLT